MNIDQFVIIILTTVGLLALAFAGIAIKILIKKNGKFEKSSCCKNEKNKDDTACACRVNYK